MTVAFFRQYEKKHFMCSLEASKPLVANVFLKKLEKLRGLKKCSRTLELLTTVTEAIVEILILYL